MSKVASRGLSWASSQPGLQYKEPATAPSFVTGCSTNARGSRFLAAKPQTRPRNWRPVPLFILAHTLDSPSIAAHFGGHHWLKAFSLAFARNLSPSASSFDGFRSDRREDAPKSRLSPLRLQSANRGLVAVRTDSESSDLEAF
ncbi:hypothetical protein F4777DRAFT_580523 [Nemania sp. FL0916]|nr:hypothetical protein F4777DRAFT_580523 [Nemania sp. FL0916]